jgi:phosphoenolpyruvate---glycerone phosphotransferase subunit DhaL
LSDALRAAILAAADAIDVARTELGVLDGAAGDGDHGMTMSIGARNVRRKLAALPPDASTADLARMVASAMGDVGGAIGPLYSAALTAIAVEIDAPASGQSGDVARLRRAAVAAEGAIAGLGHAVPGDKTILDALHPLVESLRNAESGASDLDAALEAAAEAAASGADATADLVARIGRASRLGERSRGLPDAGATSFAIIVRAMADTALQARSSGG